MLNKLLNHIVVCMFALSAVTPISAMTALRAGALARAVARHSSQATTALARNSSLASKVGLPQLQNVSRVLQMSCTQATTPHTTSLLQRPALNMQSLVRGATRSRISDAHARALNLVQRRSFSMAPLINSISTDAVGIAVSAATVVTAGCMANGELKNDMLFEEVKRIIDDKDWDLLAKWLQSHDMNDELKSLVAQYCVDELRDLVGDDFRVAIALTPLAAKLLVPIVDQGRDGFFFIRTILRNSIDGVSVIVPAVVDNFEVLLESYWGAGLLSGMVGDICGDNLLKKEVMDRLVACAAEHFDAMIIKRQEGDQENMTTLSIMARKSAYAASLFAPLAAHHFEDLLQTTEGIHFLSTVLDKSAQAACIFTPLVIEHVDHFIKSNRLSFLKHIIEKNPDSAHSLGAILMLRAADFIENESGRFLLAEIAKKNTRAADVLQSLIKEKVQELLGCEGGCALIAEILRKDKAALHVFISIITDSLQNASEVKEEYAALIAFVLENDQSSPDAIRASAVKNFDRLANSYYGQQVLVTIAQYDAQAACDFAQLLAKNFTDFYRGDFLIRFIDKNPDVASVFVPAILNNVSIFNWYHKRLLEKIVEHDSAAAVRIADKWCDDFQNFALGNKEDYSLCSVMMHRNADAARVFSKMAQEHFSTLVKSDEGKRFLVEVAAHNEGLADVFIVKMSGSDSRHKEFVELLQLQVKKENKEELSRSELHMLHNRVMSRNMRDASLYELQRNVISHERQLEQDDYVVFYHAQASEKWFPAAVNVFLDELQTGKKYDHFYYMHVKDNPIYNAQRAVATGSFITDAIKKDYVRENVQTAEQANYWKIYDFAKTALWREGSGRYLLSQSLSMNYTLRGNSNNEVSQSFPGFFVANKNEGFGYRQPEEILGNVFSMHHLDCYEQFQDELTQLHREYVQLSEYGTLYQIAIPLDSLDEMIIDTEERVKNIALQLKDLNDMHKPDRVECKTIMTHHAGGLMDSSGKARIYSYMIPKDEVQYAAWHAKWEDVKSRIKAAVESQRPADYVAPAHAQELVGLLRTAYEQRGGSK